MRLLCAFFFLVSLYACKPNECIQGPKKNGACTLDYNPVCGCNGKTYSNACAAENDGITTYTDGECE